VTERVQLRRVKGWRRPPNTVSVARPSKWGNPWRALPTGDGWSVFARTANGLDWWLERVGIVTREEAVAESIALYRLGIVRDAEDMYDDLPAAVAGGYFDEIAGKNLGCWCPLDEPCHADVLLELANGATP